jgi:lipopolysaccharide export system protein LptA
MPYPKYLVALVSIGILLAPRPAASLESDRQQPLEVNADFTDGTLGDGTAVLRGNVLIRQGTLLIKADVAEVAKAEGRVREVILTGDPVYLEQEIEEEGLVKAMARKIEYQVATGMVTLTGNADVEHPQYQIAGEILKYDMNLQHFQGSGGDNNGRIHIRMNPEVVPEGIPHSEPPGDSEEAESTEAVNPEATDPEAAEEDAES